MLPEIIFPSQVKDAGTAFGRMAIELWGQSTQPGYLTLLGMLQDSTMADLAKRTTAG